MNKNGFTLVELLVVIAIIGILSVIIVPSIVTVNQNINERLYNQKKDNIIAAAELYGSNNPDIFNGADRVYIYVHQLIDANYLEIDTKFGEGFCDGRENVKEGNGCISDPRNNASDTLNGREILLTKKNVGIVAEFLDEKDQFSNDGNTLVDVICDEFDAYQEYQRWLNGGKNGPEPRKPSFKGLSSEEMECYCSSDRKNLYNADSNMCLIVSYDSTSGNVNNWLKYGSSTPNWRVLGVYKVDGVLYPKIITADAVQ